MYVAKYLVWWCVLLPIKHAVAEGPFTLRQLIGPSSSCSTMSHAHSSSTANLVGVHYRVGKKIGEGSFGVIFEGNDIHD